MLQQNLALQQQHQTLLEELMSQHFAQFLSNIQWHLYS
jgi:hypothetical protein